ncbi:MAG: YqgE/AlgH family protein [Acidobacteriota bacterium]
MSAADLKAPILLLAMPQVMDPFFYKSVVLLLHHQDEGSQGFIVNRPTGVKVGEILEDLEIPWLGEESSLAFFGGPVQPQLGTLLFRNDEDVQEAETRIEVCPGVALTQHLGDLESLAEEPPPAFRLLLGYAGWDDGQLVKEILRNDWMTAPVRNDLLFNDDPEQVWQLAMESVGIDPAQLPSWTPANDEDRTN